MHCGGYWPPLHEQDKSKDAPATPNKPISLEEITNHEVLLQSKLRSVTCKKVLTTNLEKHVLSPCIKGKKCIPWPPLQSIDLDDRTAVTCLGNPLPVSCPGCHNLELTGETIYLKLDKDNENNLDSTLIRSLKQE